MALFDRLKKSSDPIATATIANFATDEGEPVAIVAKLAVATPPNAKPEIPPQSSTLRSLIEELLSGGPKPYAEILVAVGGNEDALRESIRGWAELVSLTTEETTLWEIPSVTLAERMSARFGKDLPDKAGRCIISSGGYDLAYEGDPPHARLYAWALLNIPLGIPGPVDLTLALRECRLREPELRNALDWLRREGDLVRSTDGRGRELFRLNVRYPEGGTDATGS